MLTLYSVPVGMELPFTEVGNERDEHVQGSESSVLILCSKLPAEHLVGDWTSNVMDLEVTGL